MNKDKLIALLKHCKDYTSKYDGEPLNVDKLADYLIANGIGDITAEKHRADVAEEAIKGLCKFCDESFVTHLLHQAEQRLKEKQ